MNTLNLILNILLLVALLFAVSSALAKEYNHKIEGPILVPQEYQELIDTLNEAVSGDTVILHINSGGGSMTIAVGIMRAMVLTQATVIARVTEQASSAAAFITFNADDIEIASDSKFGIHLGSVPIVLGRYSAAYLTEMMAATRTTQMIYTTRCCSVTRGYYPFLNEQELTRIWEGEDVILNGAEILKRLGS